MSTFLGHWRIDRPQLACIWEASARKIGNVHPRASFQDVDFMSFLTSSLCLALDYHTPDDARIGGFVNETVRRTRETVGANTNLGIALLLAPLLVEPFGMPWRTVARGRITASTVQDTARVYEAIRLANPGGLGDAPDQDVRDEPTVTLLEAMTLAADRDLIARQYANGFADVFDFGTPAFLDAFAKFGTVEAAIVDCQLRWLAAFPDSLIARKNGLAVAEDVQKRAAAVLELGGIATPEGRAAGVALDGHLRSDGNRLNPGTTADLIAACLFVALREGRISPAAPFRWPTPDWL